MFDISVQDDEADSLYETVVFVTPVDDFFLTLSRRLLCFLVFLPDAADYLREILPAFFLHQNMPNRRLRILMQQLRSEARRGTDETPLDLHKQIWKWVNSATAAHIRQLPAELKKLRANRAAEKLEKRLQRMEAQLKEVCSLSNEVDDTLRSV